MPTGAVSSGIVPVTRPRRPDRSDSTAPTCASGTVTSTASIGSSSAHLPLAAASLTASDPAIWKANQAACRVRRFAGEVDVCIGRLRRKPGGQWYFDYAEGDDDDEIGFRLGEERFVTGEYVSIGSKGTMHIYQVARVEKP